MLVVFAYEFPHQKTFEGLTRLILEGLKPDLIISSPFKKLKHIRDPLYRISPSGLAYPDSENLSKYFGIENICIDHDSHDLDKLLSSLQPRLGLILGARILKPYILNSFSIGILNAHPGLLPFNRGLDNIKWAVTDRLPQAVSFHLIDEHIDMGRHISSIAVPLNIDDNWYDLYLRNLNVQLCNIGNIIQKLSAPNCTFTQFKGVTKYNKQMTFGQERIANSQFTNYKQNYIEILNQYEGFFY